MTIVGNLGKDPEVRYAQSGTAMCTLRVAVTERVKKGEQYEDETMWLDVCTFGKTAENCGQHLAKGRQIYVDGRLRVREYEKDGVKRTAVECVANRVVFLGSGEKGPQKSTTNGASSAATQQGFADGDDLAF